jgi:hypothetical protein
MSAACFAGVPWKRTILDAGAWHLDPSLIDKHLYAVSAEAIEHGLAIPVIAAAAAACVLQMRVDVVGLERQRQASG